MIYHRGWRRDRLRRGKQPASGRCGADPRARADLRRDTYCQIQALGGQMREGEQGIRPLSFQGHRRIVATDEGRKSVTDEVGQGIYSAAEEVPPIGQHLKWNLPWGITKNS